MAIPSGVRDYLLQSGIAAVYVGPTGTIGVARDLARIPVTLAWWVTDRHVAEAVAAVALDEQDAATTAEIAIRTAADRLGVVLTDHVVVLARAAAAVGKLNSRLHAAQQSGALAEFNATYKRRRLEAQAAGKTFMPYAMARARLRKELAAGRVENLLQRIFG